MEDNFLSMLARSRKPKPNIPEKGLQTDIEDEKNVQKSQEQLLGKRRTVHEVKSST